MYVSAAISSGGATAAIGDLIDAGVLVPIVSPTLLAELRGVLRREKFRAWLDHEQAAAFVIELERLAEPHDDPAEIPPVSIDPDDDYLVALARAADADALVSGDADITDLTLGPLAVLTPRQLLDRVTSDLGDEP